MQRLNAVRRARLSTHFCQPVMRVAFAKTGAFKGLQPGFANPPTAVCFLHFKTELIQISVIAHRFDPAHGIVVKVF